MSDTETTATAPYETLSPHARMQDAIARLVGSTAPAATREPAASPETPVTAAAEVESDTTTDLNTAEEAIQPDEPAGEGQTEEATSYPAPDSVVFVADDGTPVTAEEARKGYLRQAEFTRKSQALAVTSKEVAETAKQHAEREGTIAQARDVYIARLQEVEQFLARQVPPEPDPNLRYGTEQQRLEWLTAAQDRNDALVRLATANEEKNRQVQEHQQFLQRKAAESQATQAAMLAEKVSAWKDPNTKAKETAAIRSYAEKLEFSSEEIERVMDGRADHRLAVILRDAVVGRQVREGGAKAGKAGQPAGMPQPTRQDARASQPVSTQERELRAARETLGSERKPDRFAAAVLLQARNEEARRAVRSR